MWYGNSNFFVVDQDNLEWHTFCQKLRNVQQTFNIGNIEFLADLDSASKVIHWSRTPLPPRNREIWFLADLDSGSKVEKFTYTPSPSIGHREIWIFSRFGLRIKSWKVDLAPPPPPPPTGYRHIWIFSRFGLGIKSWKVNLIPPPFPTGHREIWILSLVCFDPLPAAPCLNQ